MSTKFGIPIHGFTPVTNKDGTLKFHEDEDQNEYMIPIAFRSGVCTFGLGDFQYTLHHLKPDTKVYPLDNTPQGIYTVADLLKDWSV